MGVLVTKLISKYFLLYVGHFLTPGFKRKDFETK